MKASYYSGIVGAELKRLRQRIIVRVIPSKRRNTSKNVFMNGREDEDLQISKVKKIWDRISPNARPFRQESFSLIKRVFC